MKTLILDGSPYNDAQEYDKYIKSLTDRLIEQGHDTFLLQIKNMDLSFCSGCWSCWWKTPGECAFQDDGSILCREYINSDFVLYASPLIMGFHSALLKKVQDRLIPLLHPYLAFKNREHLHRKRYDKYPDTGLLLDISREDDVEAFDITTEIFQRFNRNFNSKFRFAKITAQSVEEVCHAINHF